MGATAGAATLISKLALSGSAKKPKAALEKELELMGAELSVSVGREQSSFTVSGGDAKQAVAILGDLVKSPGVSNFGKEKEAVLRALEDTEQPTRSVLLDRLHTTAFRDCSLGFSTIGPFEGAASLTQAGLESYVSSAYTADKMVLAASGPLKHEELVKLATASLGDVKAGAPRAGAEKPYFCGAELIYRNDEMGSQAFVSVGFEGVPWKSPDAVAFMVMQSIIGSYKKDAGLVPGKISGNRTINNIANKMAIGCADEFDCFSINYRDTGLFGFYAVCDEVAVEHCLGELMFGINPVLLGDRRGGCPRQARVEDGPLRAIGDLRRRLRRAGAARPGLRPRDPRRGDAPAHRRHRCRGDQARGLGSPERQRDRRHCPRSTPRHASVHGAPQGNEHAPLLSCRWSSSYF